ncbi:MAG: Asp-tRNA(Asn)/Glu-tRNA(Gln) amidotransferase subunit GatB [Gammaproteobacteria bacterium]|nr:Asp-tRNA(Asn)/Glu-tRNA(Gln) amidotransferase subunit GatB [Gammaproteobacteria bacterium]
MEFETVIGLEVHVQLATKSKLFSAAATTFGAEPNTQACAIDLGMPGVLPVTNKEAIRMAVKLGLGIDGEINYESVFARKNYFYPDLPKGYQISQYELPIVKGGHLDIYLEDGTKKTIGITRAHLEEDAGKSLHEDFHGMTGIDLNRASTPLVEVVSEPDMRSAEEAVAYLKTLHTLVRHLEISDANMQEGSFRCDANVSVRPRGETKLGTRTEIKNINSFRFVEKAINYEVERQINVLNNGDKITQETRLYDSEKNETRSMRSKEEAEDYRYFPDPDLLPIIIDDLFIDAIRDTLPELPQQKFQRFQQEYKLPAYEANTLANNIELAKYFEDTVRHAKNSAKSIANWMLGELTAHINRDNLETIACPVKPQHLAMLIKRIEDNTISGKIAKTVFEALWNKEGEVDEIIANKGLKQITDNTEIEKIIDTIIKNNPKQVEQFKTGNEKIIGYFIGQVMQTTQGKANPKQVNDILQTKLKD